MSPDLKAALRAFRAARTSRVIQGLSLARVQTLFNLVTSSTHFRMYLDTDSAYSSTRVRWLSVATALKMPQSVHSKQSCSTSIDPSDQTLTCFTVGFFLINRGL